jgi:hypothetical protein
MIRKIDKQNKLRAKIAMHVMAGLAAAGKELPELSAKKSVEWADALLDELDKVDNRAYPTYDCASQVVSTSKGTNK